MLTISQLLPKIISQNKILPKTVTVIRKNGKDVIQDEFVGFHVIRPSLLEIVKDLFSFLRK